MTVSDLRAKRDELDALIATARAEKQAVERDLQHALFRESAAHQRLARLDRRGRPIGNPPHPACGMERD